MAILKRQFHRHERGIGDEDFYSLARETDDGRVFIVHGWSHKHGEKYQEDEAQLSVGEFLQKTGTAQDRFLQLLGELVPEVSNAPAGLMRVSESD